MEFSDKHDRGNPSDPFMREQEKREQLYQNPNFRLVRVTKDENNENVLSMTVVTPALDPEVMEHLKSQEGYYCISHLWGPPETWVSWSDSGITDSEGSEITVNIRPEKREKFLGLIEQYDGYWWIDLFCTQHDTPLHIMGDVYRLCRITFALVDCEPDLFNTILESGIFETISRKINTDRDAWIDGYFQRLVANPDIDYSALGYTIDIGVYWSEILNVLIGWWYLDEQHKAQDALITFLSCKWFTRVWTLQENVLPPIIHYIAEAGDSYNYIESTTIKRFIAAFADVVNSAHTRLKSDPRHFPEHVEARSAKYLAPITKEYLVIRTFRKHNADTKALLITFIYILSMTVRTCLDPRDYVYGVLGLLDIFIPRKKDPKEVWNSFVDEIQNRWPGTKMPRDRNLLETQNMSDLYFTPSIIDLMGRYRHEVE